MSDTNFYMDEGYFFIARSLGAFLSLVLLTMVIIIISAVQRPLLDIVLPHRPLVVSYGSVLHPPQARTLNQIAVHLVDGHSTLRLPIRDIHSRTFQPQRLFPHPSLTS